jgi:hypothetical protein
VDHLPGVIGQRDLIGIEAQLELRWLPGTQSIGQRTNYQLVNCLADQRAVESITNPIDQRAGKAGRIGHSQFGEHLLGRQRRLASRLATWRANAHFKIPVLAGGQLEGDFEFVWHSSFPQKVVPGQRFVGQILPMLR